MGLAASSDFSYLAKCVKITRIPERQEQNRMGCNILIYDHLSEHA